MPTWKSDPDAAVQVTGTDVSTVSVAVTVGIPIAARYDELAKAMGLAFTDGKLFFSKEMPELYLDQPEVYAAKDQLVLKIENDDLLKMSGTDVHVLANCVTQAQ